MALPTFFQLVKTKTVKLLVKESESLQFRFKTHKAFTMCFCFKMEKKQLNKQTKKWLYTASLV